MKYSCREARIRFSCPIAMGYFRYHLLSIICNLLPLPSYLLPLPSYLLHLHSTAITGSVLGWLAFVLAYLWNVSVVFSLRPNIIAWKPFADGPSAMLGLLNIPNIDLTLDLTFLQISDFIHQTSAIFPPSMLGLCYLSESDLTSWIPFIHWHSRRLC